MSGAEAILEKSKHSLEEVLSIQKVNMPANKPKPNATNLPPFNFDLSKIQRSVALGPHRVGAHARLSPGGAVTDIVRGTAATTSHEPEGQGKLATIS